MARNRNVTRAGQRARVDTLEGGSFGLSVVAPNGGNVVDPTAQAAGQLMEALGVTQELAAKEGERRVARGEADAVAGDIDEDLRERSENYRSGVVKVQAEAGFIHASREMQEKLDALDLSSVEPDQLPEFLNRAIDAAAMEQYDGLDDPQEAEVVVPLLRKFREEYIGRIVEEQKAIADQEQTANLRTVAGGMYAAFTKGAEFDYNGLNERVTAVYGKTRRAQELSFGMIADIAIREGRPELLENLPEQWSNGAPTAKTIPEYADKYRAALNQAMSNKAARETEAAQRKNAADKEAVRVAELEAARQILFETRDPASAIAELMRLPGADAASVFAIQSAWRSQRDDVEERPRDINMATTLWSDIYAGKADIATVMSHYGIGTLGTGLKAKEEAQRMFAAVNQISNAASTNSNRIISEHQQNLQGRYYNPVVHGPVGAHNGNRAMLSLESQAEYNQRVIVGGEDPTKVWQEVVTKYDALMEQVGFNPAVEGSISSQAVRAGAYADRVIKAFAAGQATRDDLIKFGANPERIEALATAGLISGDEANAAFAAWMPTSQ
jgi:hypothetical protein